MQKRHSSTSKRSAKSSNERVSLLVSIANLAANLARLVVDIAL